MHLKLLLSLLTFFFMTDNGGSGDGDGEGDDEGGDNAGGNETPKGASGKPGDDAGDDDVAGLKNALKAERTKAKNADRDLKATRAELETIKNAGKSDEERRDADLKTAQARADAAEQRLQTANARVAVTDAATKANAVSVNAVFALVRDQIDYDDEGQPMNIPELIAQARKDEPTLFRASSGSGDGSKQTSEARDIKPGLDRLTHAYDTQSKSAARPR